MQACTINKTFFGYAQIIACMCMFPKKSYEYERPMK